MTRAFAVGLLMIVILLALASVAVAANDPPAGGLVIWQDEPVLPVEPDILDSAEAWARDAWSMAAMLSTGLVLAFSTGKTAFWFIVPDNQEDAIRNAQWRGLNFYSVGLLVLLYVISWIAVIGQFDYNPWLDAPLEPLQTAPLALQNAASAAIITAAAIVQHEFITGIGAMFRAFVNSWRE